ncbi:unnamed protein product, partial [Prorocentrum cordatum]
RRRAAGGGGGGARGTSRGASGPPRGPLPRGACAPARGVSPVARRPPIPTLPRRWRGPPAGERERGRGRAMAMNASRTSVPLSSPTPPPGAPPGSLSTRSLSSGKLPPIHAGGPMMSSAEGKFHWAAAKPRKACQGHNALAKASLWLEADRGERKPASEMAVPGSTRSPTSNAGPAGPSPTEKKPRAVQPRHRQGSFDSICHAIAEKATQKFRNTREAFRFIDEDHDGTISKTEMRYFFRAYDFGPEIADSFFEFLDQYDQGEIPYNDFVAFMSPHFNDVRPGSPTLNVEAVQSRATSTTPCPLLAEKRGEGAQGVRGSAQSPWVIGQKVPSKFPSLRHVWRYVDNDHDGKVSKSEMRAFFRAFNLSQEESDRLYDRMDQEGDGEIYYEHFVKYLGPFIAPDATDVSSILKAPKKTKQVVTSPADPSLMRQSGCRSPEPPSPRRSGGHEVELDQDPELRHELKALMIDIGRKLPLKFKHQRDAFRMLDLKRDGRITRSEMQSFFRGFGRDEQVADRIFDMLKEEPHFQVDFKSFMSHF